MRKDPNLFVTAKQAARIIGVEEQDLFAYEQAGMLTPVVSKGARCYNRPEIIRVMEQRDSARLPTVSQETLIKILADLEELRNKVELLGRMVGFEYPPLPLDAPQLALLYEHMLSALAQETYTRMELEDWADTLLRFRDGHIAALVTATNNDRPWIVVYRLAERLCLWLCEDPAVTENPHLRALLYQLEAAREHVRNLWCTLALLDPARDYRSKLLRALPDLDELMAEVARNKGVKSVPPMLEQLLAPTAKNRA